MNVELLEKVKAHILEEPKRLVMRSWGGVPDKVKAWHSGERTTRREILSPRCGTVGCIAGWACVFTSPDEKPIFNEHGLLAAPSSSPENYVAVYEHAANVLGLADEDRYTPLFYLHNWPTKFKTAYRKATSARARATVTAKRIDHFIKTKGAE